MDIIVIGKNMTNFHELYNKYSKDVYRFIYWMSGNSHDAEDITSETFMRAWINKNTLKTATMKAYLITIARNLYLQKIRNKREFIEVDDSIQDKKPGPDKITESKLDLQMTIKAMQRLPEIDRTILIMHTQENMTYSEISTSTGISVPAIKVKVFRARLKLETYLRGEKV